MSRSIKKVAFIKCGNSDNFFKKSWHRKARAEWRSASLARKSTLSAKAQAYSNIYDSARDSYWVITFKPTRTLDKSDKVVRRVVCK